MSEFAIIIIVFLTFLCLYSWYQQLKPMPEFKYKTRDIIVFWKGGKETYGIICFKRRITDEEDSGETCSIKAYGVLKESMRYSRWSDEPRLIVKESDIVGKFNASNVELLKTEDI